MNNRSHNTGDFDAADREQRLIWHVEQPSESAHNHEQTDPSVHADERVEEIQRSVDAADPDAVRRQSEAQQERPQNVPEAMIGMVERMVGAINGGSETDEGFMHDLNEAFDKITDTVERSRIHTELSAYLSRLAGGWKLELSDDGLSINREEATEEKEGESNVFMEILEFIMEYISRMRSGDGFDVHEYTQNRQVRRQLRLIEMRLGAIGRQLGSPDLNRQHRGLLLQQQDDLTRQYEELQASRDAQAREEEQQVERETQRNEANGDQRGPTRPEGDRESSEENDRLNAIDSTFMEYMERVERGEIEMDREELVALMREAVGQMYPQEIREMMRDMAQIFNNGEFRTYMEEFGLSAEDSDNVLSEMLDAINSVLPEIGIGYSFVLDENNTVSVRRSGARRGGRRGGRGRRRQEEHQHEVVAENSDTEEEHIDTEEQPEDTEEEPSGDYIEFIPMTEFHRNNLIPVTIPAVIMERIGMGNREHVLLIKQVRNGRFEVPRTLRDVRTMGSFDPERWSTAESADQVIADKIGLEINHVRGGVEISIPEKWVWDSSSGDYSDGPPIKLNGSSVVSNRLRNSPYFFG